VRRWGYTPQRPLQNASEQSPLAVGKRLGQQYRSIARRAAHEARRFTGAMKTGLRSDYEDILSK
jgi:hypothetical protein